MTADFPPVTLIVIGRNEGHRLVRCLQSVQQADYPRDKIELIYVDSDSADGSCEAAAGLGARVVRSGAPRPSAAAARNVGLRMAQHELIQFLDGDTVLDRAWLRQGTDMLKNPRVACAFGRCEEMNPRASIYMRAISFNWYGPQGPAPYCGGNAMFHRDILQQIGGFDESLIAGEEPELCARVRQAGYVIWRSHEPMIQHDLSMTRFRQYWKRAVRSGWAYLVVAVLCYSRSERLWLRENIANVAEVFLWGALLALGALKITWWTPGLLVGLVTVRTLWIARRVRFRAEGWGPCLLYGLNCQFVRIPMLVGQLLGVWYFLKDRSAQIMEYKD
jgi:cellulose synthase/poly-beta-1,6-N-acetylglucosamine synthase-like glycosyltransferase